MEIKNIRKSLGLSQNQFVKKLYENQGINIKSTAIANYETGKRLPRPDIAMAIVNLAKTHGIDTSLEKIYKSTIAKEC